MPPRRNDAGLNSAANEPAVRPARRRRIPRRQQGGGVASVDIGRQRNDRRVAAFSCRKGRRVRPPTRPIRP